MPVSIALAPPDLDAHGVQPKALAHERLDLPLILRGQLKDEGHQGRKDLPRWKEPVEEVLQVPQAVLICVLKGPCPQQKERDMRSNKIRIRAANLVLPIMADAHVLDAATPGTALFQC